MKKNRNISTDITLFRFILYKLKHEVLDLKSNQCEHQYTAGLVRMYFKNIYLYTKNSTTICLQQIPDA